MKKLLTLSLLSFLLFFGCNQEAEITSPEEDFSNRPVNWLTLPSPSGLSVNSLSFTKSKTIRGHNGGKIHLVEEYNGGPFGLVRIDAELTIRKNSFHGPKEISMTCTPEEGIVEFGPSMNFTKDLKFTLIYRGIDLSGVNPETIKFCYIASNGSIVEAEHSGIHINFATGRIKVTDAKIPHFSRYGWIR